MNNYKKCPLKKRPVVFDSVDIVQDQPEDLSVKKIKFNENCEDGCGRNFPLNLSTNSIYDQMKQSGFCMRYRSESPRSSLSDTSSHRESSLSPPADQAANNNIHLRGLSPVQVNHVEGFFNCRGYQNFSSYEKKCSAGCSNPLTPPSSPPVSDMEPEDLSLSSYIPLTALYHNFPSEEEKVERSRFRCEKCGKSYSTLTGLSKHIQYHCPAAECNQVKKSFSCKSCDKVYTSLGALKMHIRTHTLPCRCTICGKAFSRPWLLQGHIRTHTGEKPFQCEHCHRAFADRSNLRAHQQTHVDVKKYICTGCQKSFSRMSLLNKHVKGGCLAHTF